MDGGGSRFTLSLSFFRPFRAVRTFVLRLFPRALPWAVLFWPFRPKPKHSLRSFPGSPQTEPQRGDTFQPRATPWVYGTDMIARQSPEGATECFLFRPFRAIRAFVIRFVPQGDALGWYVLALQAKAQRE